MRYQAWINREYPTCESALAKCKEACHRMKEVFPELQITNGFVHFAFCEKREHWWCKNSRGDIIDPTAIQFLEYIGEPVMEYEEIAEDHDARKYPKKRCMECGECYYEKPELKGIMHNERCEKAFIKSLMG
jgi:hypothetical protein